MKSLESARSGRRSAAFTLIEMMVVLLILIVVMSIVLPALGRARTAAQKAATLSLLNSLNSATQSFRNDEKRLPGYFDWRDMGKAENEARGFTGMENVMLDLAGGVVNDGSTGSVEVGPHPGAVARVKTDQIGASVLENGTEKSAYFKPDAKYFIPRSSQSVQWQTSNVQGHIDFPDLVDSFGTPILAWGQNEAATANDAFASQNSATPARFYVVSNAGYLRSQSLGRQQANEEIDSLLSFSGGLSDATRAGTLTGLLGHPAFPDPSDATKPTAARAGLVYHSAGANGVFLGKSEQGGKVAGANGDTVRYGVLDSDGKVIDPLDLFDDIVQGVGN